ncbi:MAG: hypothetical protein WD824_22085 [Cyclobacteriaceae bacterium]
MFAKNEGELVAKQTKTMEVAGAEIPKLWEKQMSLTQKYYWKRGWVLPELSYAAVAAN